MPTDLVTQALAAWQAGRAAEAEALCRRAIEADPQRVDALRLRALALLALHRFPEALTAAEGASRADPGDLQAHLALAGAALALGRAGRALEAYDAALTLSPGVANAHAGRGLALIALGRDSEAVDALARAVQLDGRGAPAVLLQGAYQLLQAGHTGPAHAAFCRLLQLQPGRREAEEGRLIALMALNRYDEAVPGLAALAAAEPHKEYLPGLLFHARLHGCDWSDFEATARTLSERVRRGERVDAPHTFLVHSESAGDQLRCARTYVADKYATAPRVLPQSASAPRPPAPRLRVGYLSSDLRSHAVSQLAVGVFEAHDRSRFETYGFSTGPNDGSELRGRIERSLEHFQQVAQLPDAALATHIAALGIDILVELGGHSLGGRLGVLAHRPAPVQVVFLGFPGSCGADFVDYIIADAQVIPEAERSHYAEQVIYLPDCCLPTDGAKRAQRSPSREAAGLPGEGLVFCCFNAPYKISPKMFSAWMRLLQAVPASVLWLRDGPEPFKGRLAAEAARHGVDAARLVYAARTPTRAEHQARLALADVFLDTYPYNAHTTAVDALGAGVPVITRSGRTFASRVASSALAACDLAELATASLEEYEALALALAKGPQRLADLRARLQGAHARAPLFDPGRFCRHLEAAYVEIAARRARGERAATLWVQRLP